MTASVPQTGSKSAPHFDTSPEHFCKRGRHFSKSTLLTFLLTDELKKTQFNSPEIWFSVLPAVEKFKLTIARVNISIRSASQFVPGVIAISGTVDRAAVRRRGPFLTRTERHWNFKNMFPGNGLKSVTVRVSGICNFYPQFLAFILQELE